MRGGWTWDCSLELRIRESPIILHVDIFFPAVFVAFMVLLHSYLYILYVWHWYYIYTGTVHIKYHVYITVVLILVLHWELGILYSMYHHVHVMCL